MIAPAAVLNQRSGSHPHQPRTPTVIRLEKKETTRDRHQKHSKIFPMVLSGYIQGPSSVPLIPSLSLNLSNICSEYSILQIRHVVNDRRITISSLGIENGPHDVIIDGGANPLNLLDLVAVFRHDA